MRVTMGPGRSGVNATPEQRAADQRKQVADTKQEFARMALGMFGASVAGYPLEYTYRGTAELPDGKADVINVKGPGDFAGKLFVGQKSHLPVMFSWMAKEPPMQITPGAGGGGPGVPGGGVQVQQFTAGTSGGNGPTQEQRDKAIADRQARMSEAEARRKVVEYRMFYGHHQPVDGLQLPHTFRQAIGSHPTNEVTIEKYRVNPTIDPTQFTTVK